MDASSVGSATPWGAIIQGAASVAGQAVKSGGSFDVSFDNGAHSSATSGFSPVQFGAYTVNYGNGNTVTPTNTATTSDTSGQPAQAAPFSPGAGSAGTPYIAPGYGTMPTVVKPANKNNSLMLIVCVVLIAAAMKHAEKG